MLASLRWCKVSINYAISRECFKNVSNNTHFLFVYINGRFHLNQNNKEEVIYLVLKIMGFLVLEKTSQWMHFLTDKRK